MNHRRHIKKRLLAAQTIHDEPWPHMPIIGIAGRPYAGKKTVAEYIKQEYRCATYAFNDPVKSMLKVLGLENQQLNSWRKDEPYWEYKTTPGYMLETLEAWGRDEINQDLWVLATARRLEHLSQINPDTTMLITDVTRQNQADFVRSHGFLIHVERPIQRTVGSARRSENPVNIQDSDHIIINGGSLEDLREEALRIAVDISNRVKRALKAEVAHAS